MIKTLMTALLVALLTPQAFAQDSGSDSNSIIQMDPSPGDEAVEDSQGEVNLSPLGIKNRVDGGQPPLAQDRFLVSGTLYSAAGSILGGTGGLLTTAGLVLISYERSSMLNENLAVLGALGTVALAFTGAVVGAGKPARTTGGRCSVSGRVVGLFGGALGTMAVVGVLGALTTDDNFRRIFPDGSEIGIYVGGGIVGATLPYAGAAFGCYKTYRPNPVSPGGSINFFTALKALVFE